MAIRFIRNSERLDGDGVPVPVQTLLEQNDSLAPVSHGTHKIRTETACAFTVDALTELPLTQVLPIFFGRDE